MSAALMEMDYLGNSPHNDCTLYLYITYYNNSVLSLNNLYYYII